MVRISNVCVILHNMLIRMVEYEDVVNENDVDVISELIEEEEQLEMVRHEEGFKEDDGRSVRHDELIFGEEGIVIQAHIVASRTDFNQFVEVLKIRPGQND